MDQCLTTPSSVKETAFSDSLLRDVVPVIVKEVRSWAEEEEVGKDWREKRDKRRKRVPVIFNCLVGLFLVSNTYSLLFFFSSDQEIWPCVLWLGLPNLVTIAGFLISFKRSLPH